MTLITNNLLSIKYMNIDMSYDVYINSQDENNKKYVPDEVFNSEKEAKEVIKEIIKNYESKDGPFVYAIIRNIDNKNIGYVQLIKIKDGWEIGYHVGPLFFGKGYATEAVKLFLKYIKDNTNIKEVYGIALKDNIASLRVLEKCGFAIIYEGYGLYQGKRRKIVKTIYKL